MCNLADIFRVIRKLPRVYYKCLGGESPNDGQDKCVQGPIDEKKNLEYGVWDVGGRTGSFCQPRLRDEGGSMHGGRRLVEPPSIAVMGVHWPRTSLAACNLPHGVGVFS